MGAMAATEVKMAYILSAVAVDNVNVCGAIVGFNVFPMRVLLREEMRSGDKSRMARYMRRFIMFIQISGRCITAVLLEESVQIFRGAGSRDWPRCQRDR